jgi:hypothetical protein
VVTTATCEVCGNDYDKTFELRTADGSSHTFDSFECAIHAVAPTCAHCGCRILGHGVEAGGSMFCCARCAAEMGQHGMRDRAADGASGSSSSATAAGIAQTRPPADE